MNAAILIGLILTAPAAIFCIWAARAQPIDNHADDFAAWTQEMQP